MSGGNLTGESAQHGRSTIRRLFAYARPYRAQLIVVSLLVSDQHHFRPGRSHLLGRAIDESIIPGDLAGLARTAVTMLVIYIIGGFAAVGHGMIMVNVAQRVVANLRADLFTHLQVLSMAYHDQHRTGDLMSRVTNDTEAINQVLSNGLIQFITNLLQLAGIMVAMFLLNWRLAIGTLISAAADAADHHPCHPPQPCRLPRSAVQSWRLKCRQRRKYRRYSRRPGLRPRRRHQSPV